MTRTKGWGPFKKVWLFDCPHHDDYQSWCDLCRQTGAWHNALALRYGPPLRRFSPTLHFIAQHIPLLLAITVLAFIGWWALA